jgi:hypothetical protein
MERTLSYHMCGITRSYSAVLVLAVYESFVIVHYIWFCKIARMYLGIVAPRLREAKMVDRCRNSSRNN